MIRDIVLKRGYSFTMEDKEKCLPVVNQILKLQKVAYCEGLLALEEEVKDESYSFFMKTGIELVVDGRDPSMIQLVLQNLILAEDYTGADLLERLIIAEGMKMIQGIMYDEKPHISRLYLYSFLGETFLKQMSEEIMRCE